MLTLNMLGIVVTPCTEHSPVQWSACTYSSSNGARGRVGCLLVVLLVVVCLCPQHALSADEQHRDVDQPHPGSASSANRLADDQRAQRDQPKAGRHSYWYAASGLITYSSLHDCWLHISTVETIRISFAVR